MNKYLKWSLIFTGLWVIWGLVAFKALSFLLGDIISAPVYMSFSDTTLSWFSNSYLYVLYFIMGLAIYTGIKASKQVIVAKSKLTSVALILTATNIMLLCAFICAVWGT